MPSSFPIQEPKNFPVKVGRGLAVVTMYVTRRQTERGNYDSYRTPYIEGGSKAFHYFSAYDKARKKANEMLGQLAAGHGDAVTLTSEDKLV